jgi:hypothetical protein
MALTTAGRNAILASGAPGITHIGAYEDLGTTETSGGSYARQAITFAAAAGGIRDNNAQLSVPIAAGKTIVVASAHDALTPATCSASFRSARRCEARPTPWPPLT